MHGHATMHALFVHAYHLALLPMWRPLLVALGVAFAMRLASAGAPAAAGCAVLAGWVVQSFPSIAVWPEPPAGRLPGLALCVLAEALLRQRNKGASWWLLPATAAVAAWWLRGAPLSGAGFINTMPVFLGFLAALPLARRFSSGDKGWATLGAALALAGGLWVTGAAPNFTRAALVPACAALALLDVPEAAPNLAGMIVVMAAAAIVASDRGRLVPIDAACVAPMLVWILTPGLAPRVARSGPAVAGLLGAALCVLIAWAAGRVMTGP